MDRNKKVLYLLLAKILAGVAQVLTVPYLVRIMPLVDYGTYGQVLLVWTVVKSLFQMGLSSIVYVFFAKTEYAKATVFHTNLLGSFGLGLLGSLSMAATTWFLPGQFQNPKLGPLILYFSLSVLFEIPYSTLYATLINFDKVKEAAWSLIIPALTRILFLLFGLHYFGNLASVFALLSLLSFLQFLFTWFLLPAELRVFTRVDVNLLKAQMALGMPYGLSSVLDFLFVSIDSVMVSMSLDVEHYALYRAGAIEIPFVSMVYVGVATVILPELSKLYAQGNYAEIIRLKRRAISVSSAVIFPGIVYVLVFSTKIITAYLTPAYALSAGVFFIYNLPMLLRINEYSDLLVVSGKTRTILFSVMIGFVLNTTLNLFFIPIWGISGAAIATAIATVVQFAVLAQAGVKEVGAGITAIFDFISLGRILAISAVLPIFVYFVFAPSRFSHLFIFGVLSCLWSYLLLYWSGDLPKNVILTVWDSRPRFNKS